MLINQSGLSANLIDKVELDDAQNSALEKNCFSEKHLIEVFKK